MPADPERDAAVYRVLQEALTNVVRHAAARRVEVGLGYRAGELTLVVRDDGRGLDDTAPGGGAAGRRGMMDRARALGGEVRWEGSPRGGTTVVARFPDRDRLRPTGAGPAAGRDLTD
jgi:signal transduction histidine kinase